MSQHVTREYARLLVLAYRAARDLAAATGHPRDDVLICDNKVFVGDLADGRVKVVINEELVSYAFPLTGGE